MRWLLAADTELQTPSNQVTPQSGGDTGLTSATAWGEACSLVRRNILNLWMSALLHHWRDPFYWGVISVHLTACSPLLEAAFARAHA